jgi:hypothetical protein
MEQVQQVLRGDLAALERVASQIVQVPDFAPTVFVVEHHQRKFNS